MADQEITFSARVDGAQQAEEQLKRLKQAADEASAAMRQATSGGGAGTGGGGGSGATAGPSATQRARATAVGIPPDISGAARDRYAQVYQQAARTYGPVIADRGARATIQQEFGAAAFGGGAAGVSAGPSAVTGRSSGPGGAAAGPAATQRPPAGAYGPVGAKFARGAAFAGAATTKGSNFAVAGMGGGFGGMGGGPTGPAATGRPPGGGGNGPGGGPGGMPGAPNPQTITASTQALRGFATALTGIPLSAVAAGAAVAMVTRQMIEMGAAVQSLGGGYAGSMGISRASGIGVALGVQNAAAGYAVDLSQSTDFVAAATAEQTGRGIAGTTALQAATEQMRQANILGEASPGAAGPDATSAAIESLFLQGQSSTRLVKSISGQNVNQLSDLTGIDMARLLAQYMTAHGTPTTEQEEKASLQTWNTSPALLSTVVSQYEQDPSVQARARGYEQSGAGTGRRALNQWQMRLGAGGNQLLDNAAPALNWALNPTLQGVPGALDSAGRFLDPDWQVRQNAVGPNYDAQAWDRLQQTVGPLATDFETLNGATQAVGGTFNALGTAMHGLLSMIPGQGGNSNQNKGSNGGPGGTGGAAAGYSGLQASAYNAAIGAGLSPAEGQMFVRQMQQEHGFQTDLTPNSAGARGIAQFMPGTDQEAANLIGVPLDKFWSDPNLQLQGAAALDAKYKKQYGTDRNALIAYNAGPGYVGAATLPGETQSYTNTILGAGVQNAEDSPLTTSVASSGGGGGDIHLHTHIDGLTVQNNGNLGDPATVQAHAEALAPAIMLEQAKLLDVATNRTVAP